MGVILAEAVAAHWVATQGVGALVERLSVEEAVPTAPPTYEDGDTYLFDGLEVRLDPVRLTYRWRSIWLDDQGSKTMWAATPPLQTYEVSLWQGLRSSPVKPRRSLTFLGLALACEAEWKDAWSAYRELLLTGEVEAEAAFGNPLAEHAMIPSHAWEHIEITDWAACAGRAAETPIYSIRVGITSGER